MMCHLGTGKLKNSLTVIVEVDMYLLIAKTAIVPVNNFRLKQLLSH